MDEEWLTDLNKAPALFCLSEGLLGACTPPDMNITTPHTQRPECSAVAAAVDRSILNPGEP